MSFKLDSFFTFICIKAIKQVTPDGLFQYEHPSAVAHQRL